MRHFSQYDVAMLLWGAAWTVGLSTIAFVGGGLLGLVLALLRTGQRWWSRSLAITYIELVQGVPLLLLLFLIYFGLSLVGLNLPAIVAAAIGLTLYSAAFLGEAWRGCIQAIPQSQWEAAVALGLCRPTTLRRIILPQAARIAIPPTVGLMVQIIKNTSVASVVGLVELVRAGQIITNATFQPFLIFGIVAALYYSVCFPLAAASRSLEARMGRGRIVVHAN